MNVYVFVVLTAEHVMRHIAEPCEGRAILLSASAQKPAAKSHQPFTVLLFGTPCPQCRNSSIRQRFGYRRSPRGPRRWKQGNRSRGASSTPYVTTIVPYSPAPRDTIGLISSPPTLLSQFPISFPPTRGKTNPFRFPTYRCSVPYIILSTTDLARL